MATYQIELDPATEELVRERASRRNLSVPDYLLATLRQSTSENDTVSGRKLGKTLTGKEVLDALDAQGFLFRSKMTEDTVSYAEHLRERTQRRSL